jgi:ABC-type amino acid transport substrate-binding protein
MRVNTHCAGAGRAAAAIAAVAGVCLAGAPATAQTYGLATMQPGTLAHTTGTAIAKVLKDKGGLNTLVQTTAGETVLIPMVASGEIDLGIANLAEVQAQVEGSGPNRQADLRLIGVIHPLWASFFVRKDTTMQTNADMKGKRVGLGYSAMRFVEAYGLWKRRVWAEWFALISGALYVPFEAYELVRRPTLIHLAVLVINLGIVFYMLYLRLTANAEAARNGRVPG